MPARSHFRSDRDRDQVLRAFRLGEIYMKSGRLESARDMFADVLELDPTNVRGGMSFALMQIALGRPQAAVAQLDALQGRAADADVGLAYALAGLPERADGLDQEALIEHLLGAEEHGRAAIYAIGAARAAVEALAFDKAAELYEVAVRHHEDGAWRKDLTVQWAEAPVSAGRASRAAEVYLQAAADAAPAEASALQLRMGELFGDA